MDFLPLGHGAAAIHTNYRPARLGISGQALFGLACLVWHYGARLMLNEHIFRQLQAELVALRIRSRQFEIAAMRHRQIPGNRQAWPGAACFRRFERLKRACSFLFSDPGAIIENVDNAKMPGAPDISRWRRANMVLR